MALFDRAGGGGGGGCRLRRLVLSRPPGAELEEGIHGVHSCGSKGEELKGTTTVIHIFI